jgi:hypothetical protein
MARPAAMAPAAKPILRHRIRHQIIVTFQNLWSHRILTTTNAMII